MQYKTTEVLIGVRKPLQHRRPLIQTMDKKQGKSSVNTVKCCVRSLTCLYSDIRTE